MGTAFIPGVSLAQSSLPAQASTEDSSAPGDIIVTANRREERIQDVPIAVSVVSNTILKNSNFRGATDLQYLVPGLTFTSGDQVSDGAGYQIRGVGTQSFNYGAEQTVGLIVDGVVIGLPRDPGVAGFSDVDRVEVLRGPQGTLFGKNTSAGVIQIFTKKPVLGENSLDGHFAVGSREEAVVQSNANLAISDTAAFRLSGFYQSQNGPVPNLINGTHIGDHRDYGVRGKLLWEPNDDLSVLVTGEYQHQFQRQGFIVQSFGNNPLYRASFDPYAGNLPSASNFVSYSDAPWFARTDVYGASAEINYKLGDHTLTSVTAYRRMDLNQTADVDAAPLNAVDSSETLTRNRQITEELRLTSPSGGKLEYVLGAFYYNVHVTANETLLGKFASLGIDAFLPAGYYYSTSGGTVNTVISTKSEALFGNATYALTDKLKVIGGLRYTHDEVSSDISLTPLSNVIAISAVTQPSQGEVKKDNLSGRAGLQYQFDRDLMVYATYARGYKGPTINAVNGRANDIQPEIVTSYEAGVKATLFNRRLTFNASVYWTEFKNFQAQAYDFTMTPFQITLTNAGKLRTRGVELESSLKVMHGLTLSANGAFSDAKFLDYEGQCYTGQPLSGTVGVGCYHDPALGVDIANNAGQRLTNAPKWTYGVQAAYSVPVTDAFDLDANANWSWRSTTYGIVGDPLSATPSYGILNGTLGLGRKDGSWRVGVYARNLLNKHYVAVGHNPFDDGGTIQTISNDAFRTIGLSVDFKL